MHCPNLRSSIPRISWASCLAILLFAACGSDDEDPTAPSDPVARETIGPAGGSLTSADGRLQLTVPAGGLDASTEIAVSEGTPSDLPPALQSLDVRRVYELDPDGLVFEEAAHIVLRSPSLSKRLDEGDPAGPVVLLSVTESGEIEVLGDQRLVVDRSEGTVHIEGDLAHFSRLVELGDRQEEGYTFELNLEMPDRVFVGASFDAQTSAVVKSSSTTTSPVEFVDHTNPTGYPLVYAGADSVRIAEFEAGTFSAHVTDVPVYVCEEEGPASWQIEFLLPTYRMSVGQEIGLDLPVPYRVEWFDLVVCEPDTTPPPAAAYPVGRIDPPIGDPEAVRALCDYFDPEEDGLEWGPAFGRDTAALMLGKRGFAVVDVVTGEVLSTRFGGHLVAGFLKAPPRPVQSAPAKRDEDLEFLHLYGPQGIEITPWLPDVQDWGGTQIGFDNHTDGKPLNDDAASVGLHRINFQRSKLSILEHGSDGFLEITDTFDLLDFPEGTERMISALTRTPAGGVAGENILAATVGSPGTLWSLRRGSSEPPQPVAELGDEPRDMRRLGDVVAVTNSASGTVSLLTWDEAGEVQLRHEIAVGEGPIGLDLARLADGNVLVATASRLENTYTLIELTASGELVSQDTRPVPTGCAGPSGAGFMLSQGVLGLMLPCSESSDVRIIALDEQPAGAPTAQNTQ